MNDFIFLIITFILIFLGIKLSKKTTPKIEKNSENYYHYDEKEKEKFIARNLELKKIENLSNKIREIRIKIDNLKYNYTSTFYPDEYTYKKAEKVEKRLIEYYNYQKKIFNLFKEAGYSSSENIPEVIKHYGSEFYYYNLLQCYYTQNKFIEADNLLNECFDIIELCDTKNNIIHTYFNFLEKLLEENEITLFIKNLDNDNRINYFNENQIEDIVSLLSDKSNDRKFFVEFSKILSHYEIKSKGLIKILKLTDINLKVYSILNYAEINFKGKNYEKAKEYFEEAIKNAKNYNENIDFYYELYGDICYKLKNYNLAINSYIIASSDTAYEHRIYCKIGDCYHHLKDFKEAFKYFFFSIYSNSEYKTVQPKFINSCKRLNLNYQLDEIKQLLKKHKSLSKEEIFSLIKP